jgi:hypothetical protein
MKPSKYELYNKNGARICDAVGCRKHARLVHTRRGWFCPRHAAELEAIRDRLEAAKAASDVAAEVDARRDEAVMRKTVCGGHVHYMLEKTRQLARLTPMD